MYVAPFSSGIYYPMRIGDRKLRLEISGQGRASSGDYRALDYINKQRPNWDQVSDMLARIAALKAKTDLAAASKDTREEGKVMAARILIKEMNDSLANSSSATYYPAKLAQAQSCVPL